MGESNLISRNATISPKDDFAIIEIAEKNARDPLVDNGPLKLHGKKINIPDVGFFVKPIFSQRALDIIFPLISKDVNVIPRLVQR